MHRAIGRQPVAYVAHNTPPAPAQLSTHALQAKRVRKASPALLPCAVCGAVGGVGLGGGTAYLIRRAIRGGF